MRPVSTRPPTKAIPRGLVVIGGSAGSLEALRTIVQGLPAGFPLSVVVVLHIGAQSRSALPQILANAGTLPTRFAQDRERLRAGFIYVAPPHYHIQIIKDFLYLSLGPKENNHRPAIDVSFRMAAHAFGPRAIGVLLSGSDEDGSVGLMLIKRYGGLSIVQDPQEAAFPRMPQSALNRMRVDFTLPAAQVADVLVERAESFQTPSKPSKDVPDPRTMMELPIEEHRAALGSPSPLTCPNCGGVLWKNPGDFGASFICHVGHRFSPDVLSALQAEEVESALWSALRALKEKATLARQLADRLDRRGGDGFLQTYQERAREADAQAGAIERLLNGKLKKLDPDLVR
jgi:two-component system, chemotaxis family, protein-glutamate methylesterase/glutaminase